MAAMGRLNLRGHPSLQERVYRQLREAIISGDFVPGERLVETTLAARMGVSRSPVREAIRRLEQEGLITFTPRRGVAVDSPTVADVEDVYSVRAVLEVLAARLAARRRTPKHVDALHRAAARMEHAISLGDTPAVVRADDDFHRTIVEASGNARLKEILTRLLDVIRRARLAAHSRPGWSEMALEMHEGILDAIEQQDEARAVDRMQYHADRARQFIVGTLANNNGEGAGGQGPECSTRNAGEDVAADGRLSSHAS
ncbi:MAG: GntR family transcriptional regulator [Chloroflexi bacterium]|nr:GntR family transcriptional regulator [Chloroflexota bacterium]